MSPIIVSAMFSWKDGADSAVVGNAHRALAEFARDIPGVRVCRYGLNEETRTSIVYAFYDSPEVLQQLSDALMSRGGDIRSAEMKVTELIPGHRYIQGSQASLDSVAKIIDDWGLARFDDDTQANTHVAV